MEETSERMIRLSCLIVFTTMAALFSSAVVGQQINPQGSGNPCGDPTMESQSWISVTGKVIEIIDGNALVMLHEEKELVVNLAAVDAPLPGRPFGAAARRYLKDWVSGQQVSVWVNPSALSSAGQKPKQITGVVYLGTGSDDVNLALIRNGLARHKKSKPFEMSNYTECWYRIAEAEAREARRGLWQPRD